MGRSIKYYVTLLSIILIACEEEYHANIEKSESFLVVEARIFAEKSKNYIRLTESRDFNEEETFAPVTDALVTLIDSKARNYSLQQSEKGIFAVPFQLKKELQYKVAVQYKGDTFESEYESVPDTPNVDSIYGLSEVKTVEADGENNIDNFDKIGGLQLYMDKSGATTPYYLFTSKFVQQYFIQEDRDDIQMFCWRTIYPDGIFNIAGPPDNSNSRNILKHPLYFIENSPQLPNGHYFMGWIVILYQHAVSENTYNYYSDLNKQLSSDGKLFDPMYIQARSNIKCLNNPQKFVAGNFEILSAKEYRFFIRYLGGIPSHIVKPIPYFYTISERDTIVGAPPDFWETSIKLYPDED